MRSSSQRPSGRWYWTGPSSWLCGEDGVGHRGIGALLRRGLGVLQRQEGLQRFQERGAHAQEGRHLGEEGQVALVPERDSVRGVVAAHGRRAVRHQRLRQKF
jgi:hypothetical protein